MARQRGTGKRTSGNRRRTAPGRRKDARALPSYEFHKEPGESESPEPKRGTATKKAPAKKRKSSNKATKAAAPRRKTAKRRKTTAKRKPAFGAVFRARVIGLAWAAIFVGLFFLALPVFLPSPSAKLLAYDRTPTIKVFDRNGQTIGTRGLSRAGPVPLDEMPPHLAEAVLAVEDRRFYWHMGVDVFGLARAAYQNWKAGEVVQGGSTITQQLVKNALLSPERSLKRKIEEARYALWLEQKLTKEEILELYLNKVYLGAGTHGVEAAAQRYFGKSARDVTLVESALLAGLLKAPSRYAPTASIDKAANRTGLVLDAMVDAGFISRQERIEAHAMPARIRPASATVSSSFILDWITAQLPDYLGPAHQDVSVWTTIDLNAQRAAEKALSDVLVKHGAKAAIDNGAVVSLAADGAVRALVGGSSYKESKFNRAVTAHRPPGSAFKPFVYITAIEQGWHPGDIIVDKPIELGSWRPGNYNGKYAGPVTLEQALAQSINTVAIELSDAVGRKEVIATARRFGILSPLEPHPSLPLGTQEVNLIELSAAYVPLANGGFDALPYSIISIRTKEGELLYSRQVPDAKRIAGPYTIGATNLMLQSAVDWGTGRRAAVSGVPIAGKTGTSGDYRDAWFLGYTASMVTGVWLGNDDNRPMNKVTGGSLPAEIWRRTMTPILADQEPQPLPYIERALPPRPALGAGGLTAAVAIAEDIPAPPETDEGSGLFERIAQVLRLHTRPE